MALIDVCIIGGGFSAVPLARELDRTGADFRIVSEAGDTVWDRLSAAGRLDFDLVSSALTSFYSFDLAATFREDLYPTATQFHAMQQRWRRKLGDRTLRDRVVRVENFEDHSVVRTRSGETFEARHVVFCTGFKRAVMADLASVDYSVTNRTFLFDTMGERRSPARTPAAGPRTPARNRDPVRARPSPAIQSSPPRARSPCRRSPARVWASPHSDGTPGFRSSSRRCSFCRTDAVAPLALARRVSLNNSRGTPNDRCEAMYKWYAPNADGTRKRRVRMEGAFVQDRFPCRPNGYLHA